MKAFVELLYFVYSHYNSIVISIFHLGKASKKRDKLGLMAEPLLTPPKLGTVIWFGNVFGMLKT